VNSSSDSSEEYLIAFLGLGLLGLFGFMLLPVEVTGLALGFWAKIGAILVVGLPVVVLVVAPPIVLVSWIYTVYLYFSLSSNGSWFISSYESILGPDGA
jgi:hypothetical protein